MKVQILVKMFVCKSSLRKEKLEKQASYYGLDTSEKKKSKIKKKKKEREKRKKNSASNAPIA